ncbi:unnamed protein product [Brassica oleracea]
MNILLMILILLGLCIGSSNDLHMIIGENKVTLTLSNQLEHSKLLKVWIGKYNMKFIFGDNIFRTTY